MARQDLPLPVVAPTTGLSVEAAQTIESYRAAVNSSWSGKRRQIVLGLSGIMLIGVAAMGGFSPGSEKPSWQTGAASTSADIAPPMMSALRAEGPLSSIESASKTRETWTLWATAFTAFVHELAPSEESIQLWWTELAQELPTREFFESQMNELKAVHAKVAPERRLWVAPVTPKTSSQARGAVVLGSTAAVPVVFKQGSETTETTAFVGQPISEVATQAGQFIKYKCGKGECGTCEVMINGAWVKSCVSRVPFVPEGETYTINVRASTVKAPKKSSRFFSLPSLWAGLKNNALGMVGFFRRGAREGDNFENRMSEEEMLKQKVAAIKAAKAASSDDPASATAATRQRAKVTMQMADAYDDNAGLRGMAEELNPTIGDWDPLQLTKAEFWGQTNEATIGFLREVEIKHGRIAMFGFVGYCVHAIGIRWPWAGRWDHIPTDMSPQEMWDQVPWVAKAQIILTVAFFEFWRENANVLEQVGEAHYMRSDKPGYSPRLDVDFQAGTLHPVPFSLFDPFKLSKDRPEEDKARGLIMETNNGRLAMIGLMGFLAESSTEGSTPAVTSLGLEHYDGNVMAPFAADFSFL